MRGTRANVKRQLTYTLTGFYCFAIFTNKTYREGSRQMKLVTKSIRIDPDLWHRARVKALAEKMTLQDLITRLLKEYLGEK